METEEKHAIYPTGLQGYRATGLQVYRVTGLQGCRATGLQAPLCIHNFLSLYCNKGMQGGGRAVLLSC